MGIAAPVKLTALCRKTNSHLLYFVLVLETYAHTSHSVLNFFPVLAELLIFHCDIFFLFHSTSAPNSFT